jgi:hypothetical protein
MAASLRCKFNLLIRRLAFVECEIYAVKVALEWRLLARNGPDSP